MAKVKIFKSSATQVVYIDTVDSALPEDFIYNRVDDFFYISKVNTNIPIVARTSYTDFEGKDLDGNTLTFSSPTELEIYLDELFTQSNLNGNGFFPLPIVNNQDSIIFNINETKEVILEGSYFTTGTNVDITGLTVNSIQVISSNRLILNITSNTTESFYDVNVINESGTTVVSNFIEVKESVWTDLRVGGTSLNLGTDLRVKTGMTVNRDINGMFFTGLNPWSSWVKLEALKWKRGDNKTCQWIFTTPTSFMMIGIGSTSTNEASTSQFSQAEVQTYFNSSTNQWGLYGNNGTVGSAGNQNFNTAISTGKVYKVKFENDGSLGGTYTLYEIPSSNQTDWDNESNVLVTQTIGGSLNPDEIDIMPFIIPRTDSQRFIAVKVE